MIKSTTLYFIIPWGVIRFAGLCCSISRLYTVSFTRRIFQNIRLWSKGKAKTQENKNKSSFKIWPKCKLIRSNQYPDTYFVFLLVFFLVTLGLMSLSFSGFSLSGFSTFSFFSFLGGGGVAYCCATCCATSWELMRGFLQHSTKDTALVSSCEYFLNNSTVHYSTLLQCYMHSLQKETSMPFRYVCITQSCAIIQQVTGVLKTHLLSCRDYTDSFQILLLQKANLVLLKGHW